MTVQEDGRIRFWMPLWLKMEYLTMLVSDYKRRWILNKKEGLSGMKKIINFAYD